MYDECKDTFFLLVKRKNMDKKFAETKAFAIFASSNPC